MRTLINFICHILNYGGRGNKNRKDDAAFKMTRDVMDQLFEQCLKWEQQGIEREIVTGNNDADAVYFLHWVKKKLSATSRSY